MSERIAISRDGMELGTLTRSEAAELLQAGFLRATDLWRPETSMAWLPLTELGSNSTLPFTASIKKTLSGAGESIAGGATQVASKLKSLVGRSQNQLTMSSRQL